MWPERQENVSGIRLCCTLTDVILNKFTILSVKCLQEFLITNIRINYNSVSGRSKGCGMGRVVGTIKLFESSPQKYHSHRTSCQSTTSISKVMSNLAAVIAVDVYVVHGIISLNLARFLVHTQLLWLWNYAGYFLLYASSYSRLSLTLAFLLIVHSKNNLPVHYNNGRINSVFFFHKWAIFAQFRNSNVSFLNPTPPLWYWLYPHFVIPIELEPVSVSMYTCPSVHIFLWSYYKSQRSTDLYEN